jgi:FixJ family two-component response regulator
MPGMSGLELQQQLSARHSILPIIFITGHGDVPMAVEAMQAGAMDFIQKPFRDQDLLDRIAQALEKDAATRRLLGERNAIRARLKSLTPRETEVLNLVVAGKANVIAGDLDLSQRTSQIHRARVMEKMRALLAHPCAWCSPQRARTLIHRCNRVRICPTGDPRRRRESVGATSKQPIAGVRAGVVDADPQERAALQELLSAAARVVAHESAEQLLKNLPHSVSIA